MARTCRIPERRRLTPSGSSGTLNEDWRLISYTILPVLQVPVPGESSKVGLGDRLINLFAAPNKPGNWSNASACWPRTGARFTFGNQKAVLAFSVQA
jgi:hypothetical protein